MKKALVGILLIGTSLFSCYDSTGGFARVLLMPGDIPPGTVRIHVGVFAVFVSPSTLLAKQTFTPSSVLPMVIPAGQLIVFCIWGDRSVQGNMFESTHFGQSIPVMLNGDVITSVPMIMQQFTPAAFNFSYNTTDQFYYWNYIPGATSYKLITAQGQTVYNNSVNIFYSPTDDNGMLIKACSSIFNNVCSQTTYRIDHVF